MDNQRAAGNLADLVLSWQYLVFLLPFGASVFFLVISSLRLGGGHRHAGPKGMRHYAAPVRGSGHRHVKATGGKPHGAAKNGAFAKPHTATVDVLLWVVGANRALLPLVLQTFCLAWGICGIGASRAFGEQNGGSGARFALCLLLALFGGVVGARVGAEFLARVMPEASSLAVSRDALYGLTGKVLFPVTKTGGRVRVYDEFGTMHDEPCKQAAGEIEAAPIAKGRTVRIVDRDAHGGLLVEEA